MTQMDTHDLGMELSQSGGFLRAQSEVCQSPTSNLLAMQLAHTIRRPPAFPMVSVIIPVFEDAIRLRRCLAALEEQDYPPGCFEVIVVDNGSPAEPAATPSSRMALRFTHEPQPGSYPARNRGISIARGEILAFTDSDCIPHRSWISNAVEAFRNKPEVSVIGGRVAVSPHDWATATAAELHQATMALNQLRCIHQLQYSVTANLFVKRDVFATVGTFCAELKSAGDLEWGQRASAAGFAPCYVDAAEVAHSARQSVRELAARSARIAGGEFQISQLRKQPRVRVAIVALRGMLAGIRRIWQHPALTSTQHRIRVTFVEVALRCVWILELIRLSLGGNPRRK